REVVRLCRDVDLRIEAGEDLPRDRLATDDAGERSTDFTLEAVDHHVVAAQHLAVRHVEMPGDGDLLRERQIALGVGAPEVAVPLDPQLAHVLDIDADERDLERALWGPLR